MVLWYYNYCKVSLSRDASPVVSYHAVAHCARVSYLNLIYFPTVLFIRYSGIFIFAKNSRRQEEMIGLPAPFYNIDAFLTTFLVF